MRSRLSRLLDVAHRERGAPDGAVRIPGASLGFPRTRMPAPVPAQTRRGGVKNPAGASTFPWAACPGTRFLHCMPRENHGTSAASATSFTPDRLFHSRPSFAPKKAVKSGRFGIIKATSIGPAPGARGVAWQIVVYPVPHLSLRDVKLKSDAARQRKGWAILRARL